MSNHEMPAGRSLLRLRNAAAWRDMLAGDPEQPAWVAECVWIAECAAVAMNPRTNREVASAAADLLAAALNAQEARRTRQAMAGTRPAAADVAALVSPRIPGPAPDGFN